MKCPNCAYDWEYKPTKHTKIYYIRCPQCMEYHHIKDIKLGKSHTEQLAGSDTL